MEESLNNNNNNDIRSTYSNSGMSANYTTITQTMARNKSIKILNSVRNLFLYLKNFDRVFIIYMLFLIKSIINVFM